MMPCYHGYGPWRHGCHWYEEPFERLPSPPPGVVPRRRGAMPDEELADYVMDLEDEIAELRQLLRRERRARVRRGGGGDTETEVREHEDRTDDTAVEGR